MKKSNMSKYWDKNTIQMRIADKKSRKRFEAGSPNSEEIALYRTWLLKELSNRNKTVLVLGMTPELRTMVLKNGFNLISVDRSRDAIDVYKDWIPDTSNGIEKIINTSWWDMNKKINTSIDAVLGDGVFGNILSVHEHLKLLKLLKNIFNGKGLLIFRKVLIMNDFNPEEYEASRLIEKYRDGVLTDAEFGFAMRLWGNFKDSYNSQEYILDNTKTYMLYRKMFGEKKISEKEYTYINRYYFNGLNMILPQNKWEGLLTSAGYKFIRHELEGKDWYHYYSIYSCLFA